MHAMCDEFSPSHFSCNLSWLVEVLFTGKRSFWGRCFNTMSMLVHYCHFFCMWTQRGLLKKKKQYVLGSQILLIFLLKLFLVMRIKKCWQVCMLKIQAKQTTHIAVLNLVMFKYSRISKLWLMRVEKKELCGWNNACSLIWDNNLCMLIVRQSQWIPLLPVPGYYR